MFRFRAGAAARYFKIFGSHVFLETNKEQIDNVHPLGLKLANTGVPISVASLKSDAKFLLTQLRDAHELADWQFVTVQIYERGFSHSTFLYKELICTLAVPTKYFCKVRNVFMTKSGQYKSQN